jgi:hypothetical protein
MITSIFKHVHPFSINSLKYAQEIANVWIN